MIDNDVMLDDLTRSTPFRAAWGATTVDFKIEWSAAIAIRQH
jgi:hypothetical protein